MRQSCIRQLSVSAMLALVVTGLGGSPRAAAQGVQTFASDTLARTGASTARAPAAAGTLLDAPVSRTEYVLGPGDQVDVSIFGDINRLHSLTVTPEGTVVVPAMGVARVLGLNLDAAQARLRELVYRYYRNVDVNLTLSQVRSFKIFLLGDVTGPGVRVATASTRVSEVVPGAGEDGVARRNVLLRRANGDTLRVDLARFLQAGDLSANPTLREGDALVVPRLDEVVQVFGRVHFPGTYEYRPGETLAELLSVANGGRGFPSDAADSVRLTRFVSAGQREFQTLSHEEAVGARGRAVVLQPFDAIYIAALSNYKQQKVAVIQGQVRRPGVYPIRPDTTTVRELVELAGGLTPDASLIEATLRRPASSTGNEALRQLERVPPELLTEEERRILQAHSSLQAENVVINFEELFSRNGDLYNQTLSAGDSIAVPTRRNEVVIVGAVAEPGIVSYSAGRDAEYYIALAGGYTRRADRDDAVVLKAKVGTRVGLREVTQIERGDKVVVPYRERRTLFQTLNEVNTIVGTVSGAIISILAIGRLF